MLRWLKRFGLALCALIAVGNAYGFVYALATQRWANLPTTLLFTAFFSYILWSRLTRSRARTTDGDPGWRALPVAVIPTPFALRAPRPGQDGLLLLRSTLIAFAVLLIAIGLTLAATPNLPNGPVWPWLPFLCVVLVMTYVGPRAADRPLTGDTPTQIATMYRARFFLRLAFAASPPLIAFSATWISAPAWSYYPFAVVALLQLAIAIAPTRASLARDQAKLDAAGVHMSLVDALRGRPVS